MSKSLAVAVDVAVQLQKEGRWPPRNLDKVMGKDYRYDLNTIKLFLAAVSGLLKNGTPSYLFVADTPFAVAALQMSVGELTGAITAATSP